MWVGSTLVWLSMSGMYWYTVVFKFVVIFSVIFPSFFFPPSMNDSETTIILRKLADI